MTQHKTWAECTKIHFVHFGDTFWGRGIKNICPQLLLHFGDGGIKKSVPITF